jgi:L-threonylcarbamoyladenylate synthase
MLAGPEDIAAAVARLRAGGVVAFPTETVYGLGADAFNEHAITQVFELKGRPTNNPLIVHVASAEMARRVAAEWPREAQLAARAFWPGPLSIVLPKTDLVPAIVTGGGPNVAVRCPDHPTTLALLEAFDGPLVGPSANASGRVSPTTAAHVREAFSEEDVLVLDGGPCRGGIESTVLSLVGSPRVLRPGLLGAREIARVIGREVQEAAGTGNTGVVGTTEGTAAAPFEAPGMMASHYAPLAKTVVCETAVAVRLSKTTGAVVVTWSGIQAACAVALPSDAPGYAAGLYAALREADAMKPKLIVVERPLARGTEQELAIWMAVMDRLGRASAGQ